MTRTPPATRLAAVALIVALVAGCNTDTTTTEPPPPSPSAPATSTPATATPPADDAPTGSVQGLLDAWAIVGERISESVGLLDPARIKRSPTVVATPCLLIACTRMAHDCQACPT